MAVKYLAGDRLIGTSTERTALTTLASTGWTIPSGWTLTSGTGMILNTTNTNKAIYDFGAGTGIPVNDTWVCDFDLTRASSDHYDHPMLYLGSTSDGHGDPDTNGEVTIQMMAWSSGNTGNSLGAVSAMAMFKDAGGTRTEVNANTSYNHNTGVTLYYRIYMTCANVSDAARVLRLRIWTTAADRALDTTGNEQTTNRVVNTATGQANDDWDDSDDIRYFIVENKNGNQANWTIKSMKFFNATSNATGTPTKEFTFTDVLPNLPNGAIFEESDGTGKHYMWDGTSAWNEVT